MKPRDEATGPLLPKQQQQQGLPVADGHHQQARPAPAGRSFSLLTFLGFLFLTFNSGMAVCRSHGDRETVAFVVFSYVDLLALFHCLRRYENAEPASQLRDRLKIAVWVLTTALTLLFSFKVAAVMPPAVAVLVWLMAFATIAGGFYAFFCYNEKQ